MLNFCGEGGIGCADPLEGGLRCIALHLQTAYGRLRFLFSTSGSSELDRLFRTKNPQLALRVQCDASCGEGGIRTPGSVTFNSFQDCRNRPLCHLSGRKIRVSS